MELSEKLDTYVSELLHIEELSTNKMIDLNAPRGGETIYLSDAIGAGFHGRIVRLIKERYGKIGNTALRNSASSGVIFGEGKNILDWSFSDTEEDTNLTRLAAFIKSANKELTLKGANPLFLSVGAIRWTIPNSEKKGSLDILSPLLIFPIRFTRTNSNQPVNIEFVDDDIRLNECFLKKLESLFGKEVAADFPLPPPCQPGQPLELDTLDVKVYFEMIENFIERSLPRSEYTETHFELLPDKVVISTFKSGDLAMYYDILRNRDKIYESKVIQKLMLRQPKEQNSLTLRPEITLPADSVQENIILRAVNGDDLVIKGPPGTGKTLTISNLIAALMAAGKRVMFVSAKTSALAEVCKKMPEQLRPFILKLFCESEADAAAFEVNKLSRDLKDALEATPNGTERLLSQNADDALRRRMEALKQLGVYQKLSFVEDIHSSHSYYPLIDEALKHEGLEPVMATFDENDTVGLTHTNFLEMHEAITKCEKYVLTLTDNGTKTAEYCPWLFASDEYSPNTLREEIEELCKLIQPLNETLCAAAEKLGIGTDTVSLATLIPLTRKLPDNADLLRIFEKDIINEEKFAKLFAAVDAISKQLAEYRLAQSRGVILKGSDLTIKIPGTVSRAHLNLPAKAFLSSASTVEKLGETDAIQLIDFICSCLDTDLEITSKTEEIEKLIPVLGAAKAERDTLLSEFSEALVKFAGQEIEKLPALALKAKKGYEKLSTLGIGDKTPLADVCNACAAFVRLGELRAKTEEQTNSLNRIYPGRFTRDEMVFLGYCIRNSGNETPSDFILNIGASATVLRRYVSLLRSEFSEELNTDGITVEEVITLFNGAKLRYTLSGAMEALYEATGVSYPGEDIDLAQAINSIHSLKCNGLVIDEAALAVLERLPADAGKLTKATHELIDFVKKYELNPVFSDMRLITLYALTRFNSDIRDVTLRNACTELNRFCSDRYGNTVRRFLYPFINGSRKVTRENTLPDIFEHTYYTAACRDCEKRIERLGMRFDRDKLTILHNELVRAENDLCEAQTELIRYRCQIKDKNDQRFAFLKADRAKVSSARKFFAEYSDAILALSRCIVLSPYTVSVFMRPEAYSDFDVLIMDEASQLPPQTVIPAAFRAKQILLVGDEWQMPPIKHFVKKSDGGTEEDEFEQAESALDLAIRNASLDIVGLQCHYRSQHEALIAFSQRKYYPDMTTFPTADPFVPFTGIKDVYIPDGASVNAKNEKEAEAVLDRLRQHFDAFYDPETETLGDSIGIVVFGQTQMKLVQSKIEADKALSAKLGKALANFKDVPEKLYFLTTVEAVQGQEISHLVISLTYGRTESGATSNVFGTLNRSGLGERIFNVAVTRACKSLTLIHSILASDITVASLKYLREYLETVHRLDSSSDTPSFVSAESEINFFCTSVKKQLIELGVEEDRIVCGYGVTDRSLRIPLAILAPDKKTAELGIFCETPPDGDRFFDTAIRYPNSLIARGWKLHRIFIRDWYFNRDRENVLLDAAIKKFVTLN